MKMLCSKSPYLLVRSDIFMGNPLKSSLQIGLIQYLVTLPGLRPAAVATPVGIGNKLQIFEIFWNTSIEPCK